MRILLVCNYKKGVGGISGQVELLQKKLIQEGFCVDIFNTRGSILKRLGLLMALSRQAMKYDVIHIHCCSDWGFFPAVLGVMVGKKQKKRLVLTYHGGGGQEFFDKHPHLVKRYLTQTDVNVVLSGFLARVFDKHQLPYTIIPNIIEFEQTHFRQRAQIFPRFICIRAHEELYNIPCILKAFQIVQNKLPKATLTLVGDGSLHQQLVQMVGEMGLSNVVFTGRIDNKDIYQLLDQSDVMLSAPRIDNMPVSVLEGMNAGLLVISSNVGGVPYMIQDGDNGLLFENDHTDGLAEKMLWVVDHQQKALSIIEKAKKSVDYYSWNSIKGKIYCAYGIPS